MLSRSAHYQAMFRKCSPNSSPDMILYTHTHNGFKPHYTTTLGRYVPPIYRASFWYASRTNMIIACPESLANRLGGYNASFQPSAPLEWM